MVITKFHTVAVDGGTIIIPEFDNSVKPTDATLLAGWDHNEDALITGKFDLANLQEVGSLWVALMSQWAKQFSVTPTNQDIEEGFQTLFGQCQVALEAASTTEQQPPVAETVAEAVIEAAAEGNSVAQEVMTQVETIADQAGVSTEVAMQAIFGLKAAQNLAAKLVRSHVARQQADLQDLTAIADFLDESGTEVVAQLQAAVASKALPA